MIFNFGYLFLFCFNSVIIFIFRIIFCFFLIEWVVCFVEFVGLGLFWGEGGKVRGRRGRYFIMLGLVVFR